MGALRLRNRPALAILLVPVVVVIGLFALSQRPNPKPKGTFADAVKNEDFASVQAHIQSGESANTTFSNGHSALYVAAENKDTKMVQFLLQSGASPNGEAKGKNTALDAAALSGSFEIVRMLIDKGADLFPVSADGETPLHAAAAGTNKDIVAYLIDKGLDVNARRTTDRATPICDASSAGSWECIDLIRGRGGDINLAGFNGRTPLSLAILSRHRTVSRNLIQAGSDVNLADDDGAIPLHFAVVGGDYELVKILLEKTKNPGAYQRGGRNAVYLAVYYGAPAEILQALIDAGCKIEQKGSYQTPLSIAIANENKTLVEVLKKAGARE